jgi:hypothetical protein
MITGVLVMDQYKYFKKHDLVMCCFHEAGHTIYALLHFMRVRLTHVFEDKKIKSIAGLTHFDYPAIAIEVNDSELSKELMRAEICVNYAGLAAEKYHFKSISGSDKFPGSWKNGSSSDTVAAAALIKEYKLAAPGRKRYAYKNKLIKSAQQELQVHWDAVIQVSHALYQKKRLYYSDLKDILTKKTEDKEFWKEQFNNIDDIFDFNEDVDEQTLKSILCM